MAELTKRETFLIEMYNQLMNDINRHIVVVWQSIATLVAAIAAFGLVKDNFISLDFASAIVILTCTWLIRHVYDASYWYNRNLVIISNIERQFLCKDDLKNIHYYFGKHRPNTMISHLEIQKSLGIAVAILVLIFHGIDWAESREFKLLGFLPLIAAAYGAYTWHKAAGDNGVKYAEFLENSPGIEVDSAEIQYGTGHGFRGKGGG